MATSPIGDNDYGFHLRLGSEIAVTGPPATDFHSYTVPGAAYPDHEWLAQWLGFEAHRVVGDGGMVALQGLLVGLALGLVAFSVRGSLALRLVAMTFVFLLSLNHIQTRPHLISWVLAALLMVLLERRRYWPVPLLLLFWANCHGSLPLGVGFAGLHFLEQFYATRDRRLLGFAAASALLPLANPNGFGIYSLFFKIAGSTDFIGEWKPYTSATGPFWLLVVLFAVAVVGLLRARSFSFFDLVRVAVLGTIGFTASRNGVMAAICLAPMLGRWFGASTLRESAALDRAIAIPLALVPALVFGIALQKGDALAFRLDYERLPIESVEFLHRHRLEAPLFNDYNFGGWMLWKGWPEYRVFVDGRVEVYRGKALTEYLAASRAQVGFRDILDRYGVKTVLVRPERELAHALLDDPEWGLVYFDYNSIMFARRASSPAVRRLEVITPFGLRDQTRKAEALAEITWLVGENPRFFGGHKIRAFLLAKAGDFAGARDALRCYLDLHPAGIEVKETQELIDRLTREKFWP